ncbi:hypothetical protein ABZZ74_21410 [Streptomyces sp. NPDC006476]|uniref:hypothetical protein n=1 Tax=Streptomyces sp. NPDC006476 TaxID=3157175 RepID=UPI0033B5C26A
MSRLSSPMPAEEVRAEAVGHRGDDFVAVSAGVYAGAQGPVPCFVATSRYDGFSDLGRVAPQG